MHKSARLAAALLVSLAVVSLAHAHRLDLFVTADGAVIQGTATYSPGGPASRGTVSFRAPDGSDLGEAELQSDGTFAFQTPVRCDITIIVDTPDAHRASYTLPAAELPAALPAWSPDNERAAESVGEEAAPVVLNAPDDLLPLVERAVSRQVAPLRQEIAALERSIRFRDILGGLGYIAGLAGLLLYFKTRRPKAS